MTQQTNSEDLYTPQEEIANIITHGLGAVLSIAGATVLIVLAAIYGDSWRIISFAVYGFCLIVLYLASTIYHAIQNPKFKHIFRICDHAAIYLLIAGSYTPFALVSVRESSGWLVMGIVWAIALLGIILKVFFVGRFEIVSTIGYLVMGWMSVLIFKELLDALAVGGMSWLVAGGITYSLGVVFYAWNKLPYNHAIWHLFVVGGSICHYFALLFHVLPIA